MSENKKYYYMKFKENYFEQDHVKVIESMDNGYIYSLIILKLYLKSLKWEGQLKISELIPYQTDKINILSAVINHDPDHVLRAIQLAKEMGIIEIMSTGEIFMADIQNFIGQSSSEGERKKAYRKRLKSCNNKELVKVDRGGTYSDFRPPELELELEKEIEIEIKKEKESKSHCNPDGLPLADKKKKKEPKIYFFQYTAKQMTDKYITWFEEICNLKPECYTYDWKFFWKILTIMEKDYLDRYADDNIDQMFIDLIENMKNINSVYEKPSGIWKVLPRPSIIYKYINEIKQYINLKIEKDERYGNR